MKSVEWNELPQLWLIGDSKMYSMHAYSILYNKDVAYDRSNNFTNKKCSMAGVVAFF